MTGKEKTTTDIIDAGFIEGRLMEEGIGIRVIYKDETGSTNEDASDLIKDSNIPVLVIADKQNKGRGRRGRDFFSPKGTGLYMSLAIKDPVKLMKTAKVTANAAVAVGEAIDKVLFEGKKKSLIKWVNDIYLDEKKVCGILCEAILPQTDEYEGHFIAGIGINVYEPGDGFPADIENKAGYLIGADQCKREGLRNELTAEIIKQFFYYMEKQDESIEIYRNRSCLIGSMVRINSFAENAERECARVLGIDDDCGLIVEYEDGQIGTLTSGEVSVQKFSA